MSGDVEQGQAVPTPATAWCAVALAAAALSGCGGSDDTPDAPADDASRKRTDPESVALPLPDSSQAARFLSMAALGATPQAVSDLSTQGFVDWLQAQVALPTRSLVQRMAGQGWINFFQMSSDVGLDNVLWEQLFTAEDTLRQRVVLALSEIFVVSTNNMPIPYGHVAALAYWDLLGEHCFGTFTDLLEHITLSPAMGTYLSIRGSAREDGSGRHPDENYARELLQLFTIGLVELGIDGEPVRDAQGRTTDTYGNEAITQLARVFTGWDFDADRVDFTPWTSHEYTLKPMRFVASRYETGDKWVLKPANRITAAPGRDAVRQALEFIVAHPNVGPFIARQLIQKLVTSNPEPEHVARVAGVFNDNGQGVRGDMAAVIAAVLLDPLARLGTLPDARQQARRGKLREPVLRLVQWGRLVGLASADGKWNAGNLSGSDKLAQAPLRAPSVFNFFRPGFMLADAGPDGADLLAPEFQITDESSVIGYANFLQETLPVGLAYSLFDRVAPDYTAWDQLAAQPEVLVDRLNLLLTGRTLSAATLGVVLAAVRSAQAADGWTQARNRVLAAFYLIMCSADYLVQR